MSAIFFSYFIHLTRIQNQPNHPLAKDFYPRITQLCSQHRMKKFPYLFAFYLLFNSTASLVASGDQDGSPDEEQLYTIEVFNKDPAQKVYSTGFWGSKTEEGHVLIVSSFASWKKLKHAIEKKKYRNRGSFSFPFLCYLMGDTHQEN